MCGTSEAARYYASDGLLGDAVSSSDYVEWQDYQWPGKPFAWRGWGKTTTTQSGRSNVRPKTS